MADKRDAEAAAILIGFISMTSCISGVVFIAQMAPEFAFGAAVLTGFGVLLMLVLDP